MTSSAKVVAWGVLVLATSSTTVIADDISASTGSWTYFGNASTIQSQFPNLFSVSQPVTTPAPAQAPPASVSPPPIAQASAPALASTPSMTNAFIDFGSAPYPEISQLTTGTPQPWYESPSVTKFFNGAIPNSGQQSAFENQVLQDVQHTFSLAGMNPVLTLDPNAPTLHTLSVVSGVSYAANANAIGITDVGNNGFGFIDKLSSASSLTDLEWAVAHNVSHELMHAFGIGYHPDQTGTYIDAANATWPLLTNPNTTFSPLAAQVISATGFGWNTGNSASTTGLEKIDGDQEILAAPVPEPATVALWSAALVGVGLRRRNRARRKAA